MNTPYAARRDRLRQLMRARGLDALLVSHAANRFYLSGFELHDVQLNESAGRLVICADGRDWLCTDARYKDAAARLWDEDRILIYGPDAATEIGQLMRRCGSRLGLEAEIVSLNFARSLGRAVGRGAHLQAADGLVEELRVIKDADEIKALERSFALNHAMLRWLEESQLQPGRSEAELAWAIEKYFRDNGASELAFPSIVAVDQNAALPHAIPGEKKLPDNGLVLVDVGCRVDGYCSDQTRTFWVGDAPHKEFRETMKLVRDAQQAALDKMRPGLPLHEAYTLARGVFEKAGVEAWFTHGLGHGVGLETHEAPSLGHGGHGGARPLLSAMGRHPLGIHGAHHGRRQPHPLGRRHVPDLSCGPAGLRQDHAGQGPVRSAGRALLRYGPPPLRASGHGRGDHGGALGLGGLPQPRERIPAPGQ